MGTTFGTIHSGADLALIQQRCDVSPAQPKTIYKDVPGANGSIDLTESLGVGVKYADREIAWTFALYPGQNWPQKQAQVSNAINGLRCHIVLDDDPTYYYDGRVVVDSHASDRLLKQITVKAICRPHKLKQTIGTKTASLTTSQKTIAFDVGPMALIPSITVTAETILVYAGVSITVSAGTHVLPELFMHGAQTLNARVTSGTGSITIVWREGSL